ncbi:MAG: hypothetical protein AABX70_06810 [Nanoarchaeota archaeon]
MKKTSDFNLFKIQYDWYEGEHSECLVGKKVSFEEFERDLIKAREFAESLIGKEAKDDPLMEGYRVECLPEFYEKILLYLTTKLGYIYCNYDENVTYIVNDDEEKKIGIKKSEMKTKIVDIEKN